MIYSFDLKTVLQSVAIGVYLLPLSHLPQFVTVVAGVLLAAAVAVTLVTGADYVKTAAWIRREEHRPPSATT